MSPSGHKIQRVHTDWSFVISAIAPFSRELMSMSIQFPIKEAVSHFFI